MHHPAASDEKPDVSPRTTGGGNSRRSDLRPLWFAIVGTVLILLAVVALVWWRWEKLPDLKLNEIGDAVAGFASMLAFMWLIATILLQYKELQAQRQDVETMANAQIEQADQMRQQAQEMRDQTRISLAEYQQTAENFGSLNKERAKAKQEDIARDIISVMTLSIIPSLQRSKMFVEISGDQSEHLESARSFFDARRYTDSLLALFNYLAHVSISTERETSSILKELADIPFMQEQILLLRTLFGAMQQFDRTIDMQALGFAADATKLRLDWLLGAIDTFPSATEQMQASLKRGMEDLKEHENRFNENARTLAEAHESLQELARDLPNAGEEPTGARPGPSDRPVT